MSPPDLYSSVTLGRQEQKRAIAAALRRSLALSFTAMFLGISPGSIAQPGQTYQCPNGEVITTTDKGSREKRKNTARLEILETEVAYEDLPGWQDRKTPDTLLNAMQQNCNTSRLPAGWAKLCASLETQESSSVHRLIESYFTPYQLSVGDNKKGLFTSYYASYVDVSDTKNADYSTPIYRVSARAKTLTRQAIENGALPEAEVIYWANNAFDVYILQIQGSGVGRLPNGEKVNIAYAGKNTSNYVSLGKVLRECGEIERSKISLPTIREWVKQAKPVEYQRAIGNNQSYVFFQQREYDGEAPKGALGVPLTPMRSLAVDTRYIPLGTLSYVAVPHPLGEAPIAQAFIAQDKGGAISGGIRADIFAGEGADAADFAGRMAHYGEFWVLKPKTP